MAERGPMVNWSNTGESSGTEAAEQNKPSEGPSQEDTVREEEVPSLYSLMGPLSAERVICKRWQRGI